MFEIIHDIDGFSALRKDWERMNANNPASRIFQSFEWNLMLWQNFFSQNATQYKLYIVHGKRQNHEEEAILPAFLDSKGTLRFIGDYYSDVLDIVVPSHKGNWHVFFEDFVRFICARDEIKRVYFGKMPATSEFLPYLGVYYKSNGATITYGQTLLTLNVASGETFSSVFPHLNSKDRNALKHIMHIRPDLQFKVYSNAAGDAYPSKKIMDLRNWMVSHGLRANDALPDGLIDALGEYYNSDRCEIAAFENDNGFEMFSFQIFDGTPQYVVSWVTMHKDRQLTTSANLRYIMEKARTSPIVFDFGTGAYPYKLGTFRPNIHALYTFQTKRAAFGDLVQDLRGVASFYLKSNLKKLFYKFNAK